MPVQVGSPAPPFKAQAYRRQADTFKEVSLQDYADQWLCLYFFPLAFSPLCPTEIVGFDRAYSDFQSRGCGLLACSCDSHLVHQAWCNANDELGGLRHPIMSDITKRISMDYGVLLAERGVALRGTFLIDPSGTLRDSSVNDLPIGRSVGEVLRVIDALQSGGACPCDWKKGDATL